MLAEALIGVSFAAAAYQDVRERAVSDVVWIPALAGSAYAVYMVYPAVEFEALKLGLIGGVALAFTLLGVIGQADSIALVFVTADPFPVQKLSLIFPLALAMVAAVGHISYVWARGDARGKKVIPVERFLREQKWIPVAVVVDGVRKEVDADVNVARDEVERMESPGAMVEVKYGVPTVAYLGVGYLAYIVYLAVFNQAALLSLP